MAANGVPRLAVASFFWTDEDFAAITTKLLSFPHLDLLAAFRRLPEKKLHELVQENKYVAFQIASPSIIAAQHEIAVKRTDDRKCASARETFLAMAGPKFACFGDRLQVTMKIDSVTTMDMHKIVETQLKICLDGRVAADVALMRHRDDDGNIKKSFTRFTTDFPCLGDGVPTPQEWNDAICTFFGCDTEFEAPAKKRKRTE